MLQRDLFDDVAEVGRIFLGSSRTQLALGRYTLLLAQICELVRDTHALVIRKLDALEAASSLAEAHTLVTELRDQPLTNSFRLQGLCDVFEGYGHALERIERDGTFTSLPLDQQQQGAWVRFREKLEDREAEVASLYSWEIREIADIVIRADAAGSLDDLRYAARLARKRLTAQMAEFDDLATQFRQV